MDIQRRNFLRGRFAARHAVLLPPWTRQDQNFHRLCTRCGDCIRACPESIIQVGEAGFPELNFKRGGCTFCGDCARACTHGVFQQELDGEPWRQVISIDSSCLPRNGVACRSCQDGCDSEAIRFEYAVGWAPLPSVDNGACTGCGMCVELCPADALNVIPYQVRKQEVRAHGT